MELIRGLHNLRSCHRGSVATIGNFDGVHLGHQSVLRQVAEKASELGLPAVVITFEPQPWEFFSPWSAPPRLTRFREKVVALRALEVDRMLCLRFNTALAALPADEFIRRVLVDGLGLRHLVVGDDFRFGHDRKGEFATLVQAGEEYGFSVARTETFSFEGERVSSTGIRQRLARGDLLGAGRLLGRPYTHCGRVVHGDKRGRQLGFPTANIALHRRSTPISGVFAVEMSREGAEPLKGVANVGVRPTVGGQHAILEVHLFDFDGDLYGQYVSVEFLRKLRDERRFESFEALANQIQQDARAAREFFSWDVRG